jgi:hypothetical protein
MPFATVRQHVFGGQETHIFPRSSFLSARCTGPLVFKCASGHYYSYLITRYRLHAAIVDASAD